MNLASLLTPLRPVDAIVIIFALFLSVLNVFFVPAGTAMLLVGANIATSIGIIAFSSYRAHHPSIAWAHDWYPVPVIFLVFKEVYVVIQSMKRADIDTLLIDIDRWMFGLDPTVYLYQFSGPLLTEILQIAYTSFYFIMLSLGIELYLKKEMEKFTFSTFALSYGFFLSYIGYLLFPGIGPRFTLHDFHTLDTELPGLWLTEFFRNAINAGESIPKGLPDAYAHAQRDVFPSGHTQMTLITFYYAHMYKIKSRYALYVAGTLLIIATVYLRYHYVIDVIAGALFMAITVWTAPSIARWWEGVKESSRRKNGERLSA